MDDHTDGAASASSPASASAPAPPATESSKLPWAEPAWHGALASPYYADSHRRLQAYARRWVDEHVPARTALEWEAAGDCGPEARDAWLRSGLSLLEVPAEYRPRGGGGSDGSSGSDDDAAAADPASALPVRVADLDAFHHLILTDELSRCEGGVGTALSGGANVIGLPPLIHHGTEAQKRRWLPGLFDRDPARRLGFCLGITEPGGGSDVGNIQTTARRHRGQGGSAADDYYVVDGTKKWITGARWATHMTTAVRTGGGGGGGGGISLLVIPLRSEGVTVEPIANSGQGAGGACWVRLRGVRVPAADHLLGAEGAGFPLVMTNFNRERFVMAAGCNRKARSCLSLALEYAHGRRTFGRPLADRQLIRHKLTTLAREVESHWAWLEQIAYHVQAGGSGGWQDPGIAGRVALAKVSGGRILELAAREAQQVMGGVAYQRAGPAGGGQVEQITRDLRMMVVGGGSEEILGDLAFREEVKRARKQGAKL